MQVLVSDTSVLIDIQRASLLARLFSLPYDFVVPDLLYETELIEWMGPELLELGLQVTELEPHEIIQATTLKRAKAALSTPDVFAFCLAAERGWTLLTGDGAKPNGKSYRCMAYSGFLTNWSDMKCVNLMYCGLD